MAAVDVLGRVDELADGTGGSVDAVTGTAIGPHRKSRLTSVTRTLVRTHSCGRALLVLVTLWLTTGCAFYQFRVWPNYDFLKPTDAQQESTKVKVKSSICSNPELKAESGDSTLDQSPDFRTYGPEWQSAYGSMCRTINMAGDLEAKYEGYERTHERTGPVLLTALTPIAATIAGLGATGTSGVPITALALTGGAMSAYGIGLSSVVRERIYAEGKVGTRCLIDLYEPVLPPARAYVTFRSKMAKGDLQKDESDLDSAIRKVSASREALTTAVDVLKAHDGTCQRL